MKGLYFVSPCRDNCEVSEVVEQLLRQLEISFKNFESLTEKQRERQDKLDIKCLQIMRAIIHNEIVRINPQLLEDSPPDYRNRCVEKVHPLQNAIQDFDNAVSRVIPMLSHPNDAIVCEVLAFLKAIFFSGNRHVQQGMKHLLDTREERLFTTVQALLKNSATSFNESRGLIAEMNSRITDDIFLQTDATTLLQPPCIHNSAQQRRNKLSTNASISIDMDEGLEEDSLVHFRVAHIFTPSHAHTHPTLTAPWTTSLAINQKPSTRTRASDQFPWSPFKR